MTELSPITPPPELVEQWRDLPEYTDGRRKMVMVTLSREKLQDIATQAARWGADQQLKQDAKWLDSNALYTHELIVSPSGDALRQIMRPKPLSLAEETLTKSAQAVLDAFRAVPDLRDCPSIAAALRAAADHLPSSAMYPSCDWGYGWSTGISDAKQKLLAIAAELKGNHTSEND